MPHLLHRLKFPENAPLFWLGSPKIPSFPLMNDPERHETTGNYDEDHRNLLKRRGKGVCKGKPSEGIPRNQMNLFTT